MGICGNNRITHCVHFFYGHGFALHAQNSVGQSSSFANNRLALDTNLTLFPPNRFLYCLIFKNLLLVAFGEKSFFHSNWWEIPPLSHHKPHWHFWFTFSFQKWQLDLKIISSALSVSLCTKELKSLDLKDPLASICLINLGFEVFETSHSQIKGEKPNYISNCFSYTFNFGFWPSLSLLPPSILNFSFSICQEALPLFLNWRIVAGESKKGNPVFYPIGCPKKNHIKFPLWFFV